MYKKNVREKILTKKVHENKKKMGKILLLKKRNFVRNKSVDNKNFKTNLCGNKKFCDKKITKNFMT